MPFVKVDIDKEIEKNMKDPEFAREYEAVNKEFEVIRQAKKLRKEMGVTQPEIASKTGMTQQAISRMEKLGSSPSLINFTRYLNAAGLEMKIEKKTIGRQIIKS